MKGDNLKFTGNSQAAIVNLGNIHGANGVFLIAQKIDNMGTITAPNGEASLAAGSEVLLQQAGNERISILVGATADGTGINNSGEIAAAVATMKATGSMYSVAVNNSGIVRAQGVDLSGGRVRLTAAGGTVINSGTLSATKSNRTGGTVIVEGKNISLSGTSVINVSALKGGGTAWIGGGFQGKNSSLLNAETVTVAPGAVIRADATESGNGGQVAVWSDNTTVFGGQISAQALGGTGRGGQVEISGKLGLVVSGFADLRSINGSFGTLLLDPGSVTINHSTSNGTASQNVFGDSYLNTQLGLGSVTISTANSTDGLTEDLTVTGTAAISWTANTLLTLNAGHNLTISAGASLSSGRNTNSTGAATVTGITLIAGNNILIDGTLATKNTNAFSETAASNLAASGNITLTAGGSITGNGTLTTGNSNLANAAAPGGTDTAITARLDYGMQLMDSGVAGNNDRFNSRLHLSLVLSY